MSEEGEVAIKDVKDKVMGMDMGDYQFTPE